LETIKKNLLEGEELFDQEEEIEEDEEDEDEKFLPEHQKIIAQWKGEMEKIDNAFEDILIEVEDIGDRIDNID